MRNVKNEMKFEGILSAVVGLSHAERSESRMSDAIALNLTFLALASRALSRCFNLLLRTTPGAAQ